MIERHLTPSTNRSGPYVWINGQKLIDFTSNDALGLSQNKDLAQISAYFLKKKGMGSTGSRLLSGDSQDIHSLEETLSNWLNVESALVFNSGYHLNTGLFQPFFTSKDVIFADKHIHASLIDGIRLSGAKLFRYKHLDIEHLETLLQKHRKKYRHAALVTESLFSMDGDTSNLNEHVRLKQSFDSALIIDEAHSFGIYGPDGKGFGWEYRDKIDFWIGTFGKAFGSMGAFLCSSPIHRKALINQSRSFLFSTALPYPVIKWNTEAISTLQRTPTPRESLISLTAHFREAISTLPPRLKPLGNNHIIPIITGSSSSAERLACQLREKGFFVLPIRPPTVSESTARIRISLSSVHNKQQLDSLAEALHHADL